MGKLFSWSELINPATKKENYKKPQIKRTLKQIKECLILDQLFWIQNAKKPLSQSFEKVDKNWYCQVMKGAKYSRIGDSFIDPNQNVKCVKIERPDMNKSQIIKPRISVKRQAIKREIKTKVKTELKTQIYDTNPTSSSSSIDDHSSCESSGGGSLLSASEIVRQAQKLLPKLEISPSCFSNPVTLYQTPSENIDLLNYDFSFTSPLIKS